jgi:hypothetical protein
MKLLATCACLLSVGASAADLGYIQNSAGGQIILSIEKCDVRAGHVASGTNDKTSETIRGCYVIVTNVSFHPMGPRRYL